MGRAFGPQSGKLLYVINDAHVGGVTAVVCGTEGEKLVSGGMDGSVRVWRVSAESRLLLGSMKEHKAAVNCLRVRAPRPGVEAWGRGRGRGRQT